MRYIGVSKAHWNAFYDIRVNTRDEQKPVELAYKASISQNTGENWKDVGLTLETAEPTFGGQIPRLHPWIVLGGSISKTSEGSRAPHTEAEKMGHGEEHHANIIATFTIEGKMHIPCDGATHSVSMMTLNLDSKTYWVAVPKREARAHVRAKIKNASEYPLLGGPAHVYVDGSFIASMELPVVCPGEYFDCPLGHDPSIHLTYHPRTKKTSRTGFYSKSTTQTFTQRTTIINMKTSAIEGLRVYDQFPVSEDPRVSVKYISPGLCSEPTETTSGEIKVLDKVKGTAGICARWSGADEIDVNCETFGKDGKFEWICAIPSQGKIELQSQFEVTAPLHSQIVGL
ncbi:hypothetical protein Agabi119p4_7662 [Agaricus bisporus var. burnettii]|uniref:DUF4139 domain-containing protein n=1 Tax=Agaricus bisporus var. burnettii TaxID=192524 RepID=A0A8H7C9L4_AGABI|nr:hypothetical protein Agabi119p4_7662 [Agaricus bisporus var. burnettii]